MPALPRHAGRSLLGGTTSRCFEQRRLLLSVAAVHPYRSSEWQETLVVVEHGRLELEWRHGARLSFEPGDTLCLSGLDLLSLRSVGPLPTLLLRCGGAG